MLFRKTSRKNRRNVNPRLTGLESLEGRKLMAGDTVTVDGEDFVIEET